MEAVPKLTEFWNKLNDIFYLVNVFSATYFYHKKVAVPKTEILEQPLLTVFFLHVY
jgi:hypothetical protein